MFNMLLLMRDMGCRVQFLATKATGHDAYAASLQRHGIELAVAPTRFRMLRWWYLQGSKFDVVILSRLPVALGAIRHVRRYASQASVVFDTVDLHFLRISRQAALHADSEKAAWADQLREYELGLMQSVDLTVVVSSYEQKLLHAIQPTVPVKVLSNIHAPHGRQLPFCARSALLYVGNFEHEPNLDAARWLVNELMPVLRGQLQGIRLHIVGHASDEVLGHLASVDVIVHGYVADLAPMLGSVKLAVVPLRYGAGVKGKINLAMSYGVPVVTTAIGAEGMNLQNRRDAMIAEGAEKFASAIVEAYTNEPLWLRLSDAGVENVKRHFSPEVAADVLKDILGAQPKS